MRRINKILIGLIIVATMFLSIGYSAIENITLDIKGIASASQTTFPYLPTGFSKVEGTTLETGLVIQDGSGNQYVWVEVPKDETVYSTPSTLALDLNSLEGEELQNAYNAIEGDLHTYTTNYRKDGYTDQYSTEYWTKSNIGLTEEKYYELKNKMLKSVFENGGFYIGRYETGKDPNDGTPVIKQNVCVYNNVNFKKAQELSSGMESGEHTSSLMFGVQWDLILKYLERKGVSYSNLTSNSSIWGNCYNGSFTITNSLAQYSSDDGSSYTQVGTTTYTKPAFKAIILTTGSKSQFSKMGIDGLAGNVHEVTLENSSLTTPCVRRGGSYVYKGYEVPASARRELDVSATSPYVGFRVTIY